MSDTQLPTPYAVHHTHDGDVDYFTADQMRAYASEAVRAALAAQGEPVMVQHRKPIEGKNGETTGYTSWIDGKGLGWWPHRYLYTASPAKPMTDDTLTERRRIVDLITGRACMHTGPHRLTLELNQLAAVVASGLGWIEYERRKHHGTTDKGGA